MKLQLKPSSGPITRSSYRSVGPLAAFAGILFERFLEKFPCNRKLKFNRVHANSQDLGRKSMDFGDAVSALDTFQTKSQKIEN